MADNDNLAPFVNLIGRAAGEALLHNLSIFGRGDELIPLNDLAAGSLHSQAYQGLRARQGRLEGTKIAGVWYSTRNALKRYTGSLK